MIRRRYPSLLPGLLMVSLAATPVVAQESFRVELGRDGETLGDMRPVFLKFESRTLPAISPAEVARRYQKLFETSDEPEVRIDALNRLNNIRDQSGQELGFTPEQEALIYDEVLESYEDILARGSFSGRLDELLYQMAKAHALTGQPDQSIDRLTQLAGLYPNSALAPEARFRIAESEFSAGRFRKAEVGYQQLLGTEGKQELAPKARYMMAWSQFKQGPTGWVRSAESFLALLDEQLPTPEAVASPPAATRDMLEDSFRILAVMASRLDDTRSLAGWLERHRSSPWVPILYDRLADLHAHEGRFEQAVAVNEAFARAYPQSTFAPDLLAQSVAYWRMAGADSRVRDAMAAYVAHFGGSDGYAALSASQQQNWREYARFLADHHYAGQQWDRAAQYYEQLALRADTPGTILHLAGDARLQAGQPEAALVNFEAAAYQHRHERSVDSAWAGITIRRGQLDDRSISGDSPSISGASPLADLSAAEQRYYAAFGPEARLSGLRADLANRWLDQGDPSQALHYARATLDLPQASDEEQYAAWLVTAKVRQQGHEYTGAEAAWRQALSLVQAQPALARHQEDKDQIQLQLAASVYRQAEAAAAEGKPALAVANFQRVETVLPGSEVAIRARFDAANTWLIAEDWQSAINELRRFRSDYPGSALASEIPGKLVYAYQQAGQPARAAEELVTQARNSSDPWPLKIRAAELYHQAGATEARNELYEEWLAQAPTPATAAEHVQQQTIRQRLIEAGRDLVAQQQALLAREEASQWHSEETLRWSADAALELGAAAAERFAGIPLTHPLPATLTRKQRAMDDARQLLLRAESLGGEPYVSQVLYRRAELYRTLAADLMASEVPAELNELEAMQYRMLLEEEAFPLEERAMALHATNHARIPGHGFDEWISLSLKVLSEMHPGRYQRELRWMSWTGEGNHGA
ncbi:MAG TPA: tetratricopeptide repeat protein [Marinobacter sp.]|nr:tetratricopeptide repeat protein [Marinobacter sp.]